MESIVSPWLIYLLSILENLNVVLGVSFCLFCVAIVILVVVGIVATCSGDGDDVAESLSKIKTKHYLLIGIFLSLCLLVPSKNSVISMYVADQITYDRAEKAVDIAKDIKKSLKQDVIDIIQEVTKEKDEN